MGFNPRTRVGCDLSKNQVIVNFLFQSTHPCGVRPICSPCQYDMARFNPRTRVGCDNAASSSQAGGVVSIHAPVWGATNTASYCLL